MQAVILAFFGALAVNASTLQSRLSSDAIIDYINNEARPGWTAGRNFNEHELQRLIASAGESVMANGEDPHDDMPVKNVTVRDDLPTEFDARVKWPNCDSLKEIRNQGSCNGCWAFATAAAITDRICIKGLNSVRISSEDLMACCGDSCGKYCGGGFPAKAWQYFHETGVVTGGPFDSQIGCMPSLSPPKGKAKARPSTPKCEFACRKGYPKRYEEDKHKGKNYYLLRSVEQAMQDIVDHGPVTAVFRTVEDFYGYKSGVYHKVVGWITGSHVVKLIGFGTEGGDDYWLAANSWGSGWAGDNGFFKIRRGSNECGIEEWISGGEP